MTDHAFVSAGGPTAGSSPGSILDELTATVPGALGAVLASVDGFGIAHSASMPHDPAHAAMLAAAVGLGTQLIQIGEGTDLRQLVAEHDGGLLLLWPIGRSRVLAVHAATNVDQVKLRAFVRNRANHLATAI